MLTPSFLVAGATTGASGRASRLVFQLANDDELRLICAQQRGRGTTRPNHRCVTGERFATMAGIGQGWIEEAIPTRDGAPTPAARLLRSILLLTSP